MAEIAIVRRRTKDSPVLLLDDVLSELDRSRQAHLLENISGIQTFVTCTGMEELVEQRIEIDRVYHVEAGRVAIKNEFRA
jgi:DNA replication and repair protein RecF